MIRINNIKIRKDLSENELLEYVIKKNKINKSDIIDWHISKKSIDARDKMDVHYSYSVDLELKNEEKYKHLPKVRSVTIPKVEVKNLGNKKVVIVGAGPSGLFAALTCIQNGLKPIVIEQGEEVRKRKETVDTFLKNGILSPLSNVQFGEGGAGTFSDGKLTTGINSPFCKKVLEEFVNFGAPKQILYLSKPHIGTDNLILIIENMRKYIISNGGVFLFNTKVTNLEIENNNISNVIVTCNNPSTLNLLANLNTSINYENSTNLSSITDKNRSNSEIKIPVSHLILAIGHSSRDTFEMLYEKGINMEQKNFSVGVRIEHLQEDINMSQYGTTTKLKLPPAEYKLAYHSPSGRSCYTFCMCPGGTVIASSSEKGTIVTNGMSNFLRDGKNANSALLVNVTPDDFSDSSPLSGIYFQKDLEEKAFTLGGSNYFAPIQRVEDFLDNKKTVKLGKITPSYLPGVTLSNLNEILPSFVSDTLKEGIKYFDTKLKNFGNPDSILTGVETRSSSPVKIPRNENFISNINGIYPCGEGAGYAGGIMSAAVDGIKCAIAVLSN